MLERNRFGSHISNEIVFKIFELFSQTCGSDEYDHTKVK